MGRNITVINEQHIALARSNLREIGKSGVVANRLKAIIAAFTYGIKDVCKIYDVSRDTLNRWMKTFKEEGVSGLENDSKPSRSKLNEKEKEILKKWVEEDPSHTLKTLVAKCADELDITITKSSIHRILGKLGFAHIIARKKHYKADEQKQEDFKKTKKRG
jgi:transposase